MGKQAKEYAQLKDLYEQLSAVESLASSNKSAFYTPIESTQKKFHETNRRVRIVLGGNRSGKTTCGTLEVIAYLLGYRPWLAPDDPHYITRRANGEPMGTPVRVRVIAASFETAIVQTIFPKFKEWLPKDFLTKIHRNQRGVPARLEFSNGSIIYFMSYDQDEKHFEGFSGELCWYDEPPPQPIFYATMRSLIDSQGVALMTMTPVSEPWISELTEHANEPGSGVATFIFPTWSNAISQGGYLDDETVEQTLSLLTKDQRAAREKGEFLHLAGRVFPEWAAEPPYWIDPFPIPNFWPRICIMDPHPQKPMAVTWLAVDPENTVYVYRSSYDEQHKTISDISDYIKREEKWAFDGKIYRPHLNMEPVPVRIIDTSANETQRGTGRTIRKDLMREGLLFQNAQKRGKDAGINAIREALVYDKSVEWAGPSLVVFNTCPEVKSNFLKFVWQKWATSKMQSMYGDKPEPQKVHDDFLDCIRYAYQGKFNNYNRLMNMWKLQQKNLKIDDDDIEEKQRHIQFTHLLQQPGI